MQKAFKVVAAVAGIVGIIAITPIVALAVAHVFARRPDFRERPWIPFAWVAFICFGLTLRALMTGLGA